MTMNCQVLYDLREQEEAVSGSDLHEIFRELTGGEPSPSGYHQLDVERVRAAAVARPRGATTRSFLLRAISLGSK